MHQPVGRFAPSPTGPLHLGSLVAAMASWLDVRARGGRWIVRLEDIDTPREVAGAADQIIAGLTGCGFRWDGAIARQSARLHLYENALDELRAKGLVYPCACTRRDVEESATTRTSVYPGTCRGGLPAGRTLRTWRMRVPAGDVGFTDRAAGFVSQDLERDVGDFVVRRADGFWAYQLAVVVDDADQGVTDVVRGADLLDSTPRQRVLQDALGLPHPTTLHVPLVVDAEGRKLAKSHGASALDPSRPLPSLHEAACHLRLDVAQATTVESFWESATRSWAARWLDRATR